MKTNRLLKWLLIPVLLLAAWVVLRHPRKPTATAPRGATASPLSPAEMADLGIPADTPRDTVATLVDQVQHLRGELEASLAEDRKEQDDNNALKRRLTDIDARIDATRQTEADRWQRESAQAASDLGDARAIQTQIDDLQSKVNAIGGNDKETDLPIGLGLQGGNGPQLTAPSIRWIDPIGLSPGAKTTSPPAAASKDPFHFETDFNESGAEESPAVGESDNTPAQRGDLTRVALRAGVRPVYTVPANATLLGSVAMTALIGRIPVDGTVEDPYPFKVLIGADNLTANGIELPNIAGAVMSGTASGDWTLSCVRGRITSITFVFQDGTVRTVPSGAEGAGGAAGDANLGWISDPYGIPCVSGKRRSNARQYLTSQMLITAAGAGAASLIRSQNGEFSYVAGENGTSLGTVGISGNEAMGRIISGGVEEMSQWVNKLYGQAFAAIYVPPGARVAVHIVRPIDIDYDGEGRRVRYEGVNIHAPNLD